MLTVGVLVFFPFFGGREFGLECVLMFGDNLFALTGVYLCQFLLGVSEDGAGTCEQCWKCFRAAAGIVFKRCHDVCDMVYPEYIDGGQ